jgi:hypothetical protein
MPASIRFAEVSVVAYDLLNSRNKKSREADSRRRRRYRSRQNPFLIHTRRFVNLSRQ